MNSQIDNHCTCMCNIQLTICIYSLSKLLWSADFMVQVSYGCLNDYNFQSQLTSKNEYKSKYNSCLLIEVLMQTSENMCKC